KGGVPYFLALFACLPKYGTEGCGGGVCRVAIEFRPAQPLLGALFLQRYPRPLVLAALFFEVVVHEVLLAPLPLGGRVKPVRTALPDRLRRSESLRPATPPGCGMGRGRRIWLPTTPTNPKGTGTSKTRSQSPFSAARWP